MSQYHPRVEQPLRISNLLDSAGTMGCYQVGIILMCCFLILQNGMLFLASAYTFALAPYDQCHAPHQGISLCTKYVCALPLNQRAQYENPQIAQLKTLGNQFGNFHCQKEYQISFAMGLIWIGALIAACIVPFFADNYGRRLTIIISQIIAILGFIIILMAPSLLIAELGIFVVGFSEECFFVVVFCILQEILSNQNRQKFQIIVQINFCLGGLFNIVMFYFLKDWKLIFTYCNLIPLTICIAFSYFFFQQTPQFLVKLYPAQQIRNSLIFIAKLNKRKEQFDNNPLMTVDKLEILKKKYNSELAEQPLLTFSSLFEYPSLRLKAICTMIIWFSIGFLYYAPFILVNQFGFNFFLNGILLDISEVLTYLFTYFAITHIKRKKLIYTTLIVIFFCCFALIFIDKTSICTHNCWNTRQIFQVILFFGLLFAGALTIETGIVYTYQLYPVQVSALGFGIGQCTMCLPNIFIPSLIVFLNSVNFPVMIVFCLMVFVCIGSLHPLEETFGIEPAQMVQQLNPFQAQNDQ